MGAGMGQPVLQVLDDGPAVVGERGYLVALRLGRGQK